MGVSSNNRFNQDSTKNTPPVKLMLESITLVGLTYRVVDVPTAAQDNSLATTLVFHRGLWFQHLHKASGLPGFARAGISCSARQTPP